MKKTILALGFFDGVHLGHQALLAACRSLAEQQSCAAGALTFTSHPDGLVLGQAPKLLCTAADRKALLSQYHMDLVAEIPFDRILMSTHWSVFLGALVEGGAVGFVCGDDFRFGSGGLGTAKKLEAYCKKRGLSCAVIPQQDADGQRISSTRIRALLEQGDMAGVNRLLGHPHRLTGRVVPGRGLGHTIGIPTANLAFPEDVLLPGSGVYACRVLVEGKPYPAVTNVGSRPTVGGSHITVEPWLLEFEGDLYGKEITLEFFDYLRPEQKFDTLEDLKAQILRDAKSAQLKVRGEA